MLLARGSHGNLHILSQQSEKLHEAFHGQGSRAVAHERRNVGLLDTQDFSSFGLLKAPSFNKAYDSRDAAIALHRTADSSLASPSKARLRTSLGMTRRLGNATSLLTKLGSWKADSLWTMPNESPKALPWLFFSGSCGIAVWAPATRPSFVGTIPAATPIREAGCKHGPASDFARNDKTFRGCYGNSP